MHNCEHKCFKWLVVGLAAAVEWEVEGGMRALVMMMAVDYTAADDVLPGPH